MRWILRFVAFIGVVAFGVVVAGVGCGDSQPAEPTSQPVSEPEPAVEDVVPEVVAAPTPTFEVHEWGLIDFVPSRSIFEIAAGPGEPERVPVPVPVVRPNGHTKVRPPPVHPSHTPMVTMSVDMRRRKPVLYFHLGPDTLSIDVSVSVSTPPGRVVEHWPTTDAHGAGYRWLGVEVTEGSCTGLSYPSATDPECADVEYCEVAELAQYESNDADCLNFRERRYNHLFYRGAGEPSPLPLVVTRDGDGVQVSHGGTSAIPGSILYIVNESGTRRAAIIAPPAVGEEMTLPEPEASNMDAAQTSLDETLSELGLTAGESGAFKRAWDDELFGADAVAAAVLYFLPRADVVRAAPLEFEPAPTAIHRAMLVRIDIAP
jgi:hypothetical protein